MIYKGITILDKNLHPFVHLGYGGRLKFEILEKIANYANTHDTKTVSIVRLVHPGEASAFGVDDIIKIGTSATGIINWGIWKVYGDPHMKENPRGRHRYLDWKKETEEAAEELSKRKRKKSVYDMSPEEKKQMVADMMKKGVVVESTEKRNPREGTTTKVAGNIIEIGGKRVKIIEKASESADIWLVEYKGKGHYVHGSDLTSKNPRKKDMVMGITDKSPTTSSVKKIMDEIDEQPSEWRFRMQPPSKFHEDSLRYGSKSITRGVRAVYGCPKDDWASNLHRCKKGMVMQSLRLMRTVFKTKESAAKWIARHTKPRRE